MSIKRSVPTAPPTLVLATPSLPSVFIDSFPVSVAVCDFEVSKQAGRVGDWKDMTCKEVGVRNARAQKGQGLQ